MESNKDYYALYLKYKSKYLALKTGGAESYVVKKDTKGKDKTTTLYKTKIVDIEKTHSLYIKHAESCEEQKNRECNEDEVIQVFEDSILKNPDYIKIAEEYVAKYPEIMEKIKKQAQEYVNFVSDETKKNKDCNAKTLFGLGCEKNFSDVKDNLNHAFRHKLQEKGEKWLKEKAYPDIFRAFDDVYKNLESYEKDPMKCVQSIPFNPTGMSKDELVKEIWKQTNQIKGFPKIKLGQ
jgi:hypothetical protein